MPFLATQAIDLTLVPKEQMFNKNKSQENTFLGMPVIFLEYNLKIYSVRLMAKLVLLLQTVTLDAESITHQVSSLPLWLKIPLSTILKLLTNLTDLGPEDGGTGKRTPLA